MIRILLKLARYDITAAGNGWYGHFLTKEPDLKFIYQEFFFKLQKKTTLYISNMQFKLCGLPDVHEILKVKSALWTHV